MPTTRRPITTKPRIRRDGAVVRAAILDAAERRLIEAGPAALRLQDVAADAGISHPNVLHHFGSREGLISAVIARSLDAMNRQLVEGISRSTGKADQLTAVLDSVFEVMSKAGHGRLIMWLSLAGHDISSGGVPLTDVVEAAHALRKTRTCSTRRPSKQDTANVVMLAAIALTGATVHLPSLLRQLGQPVDEASSKRFRTWFSHLLLRHMDLDHDE